MLRFARWKIISILGMTALAFLVIVPSLLAPATRDALIAHSPKWLPVRAIVLGLDLQGGSHVMLEVDSQSVVKTMVDNLRDSVRRVLRDEKVSISGGIGALPRGVQLRIPDPAELQRVLPKLQQLVSPASSGLGAAGAPVFDIATNSDGLVQFTVTDAGVKAKVRRAVEQSIEVLRRRVDALGTTEPTIQREGDDRVVVEVPGLQDTGKLKEILGTTAKLEFRLVGEPGEDPSAIEMLDQVDNPAAKLPVEKQVMVQGEDLTDAQPGFDQRTQEPVVNFRFNIRGGQRFGEVTAANVGRPSPSCSTARSSPRRAFWARSWAAPARFPVISRWRAPIIWRSCSAPARCRPSSPLSRSAPSGRALARIRSTPASARPMSARRSSASTC